MAEACEERCAKIRKRREVPRFASLSVTTAPPVHRSPFTVHCCLNPTASSIPDPDCQMNRRSRTSPLTASSTSRTR
jgi:hypothetical protein